MSAWLRLPSKFETHKSMSLDGQDRLLNGFKFRVMICVNDYVATAIGEFLFELGPEFSANERNASDKA